MNLVKDQFTEQFMEAAGHRFYCLSAGSGKPLLLLHGFPTSSFIWRKIIPQLATIRQVIAPDLLGHGKSDKPADLHYSFERQSQIIDKIMDHFQLEQIDMVLHDIGGPTALLWLLDHPERAGRVVIMNSFATPNFNLKDRTFLRLMQTSGLKNLFATRLVLKRILRDGVHRQANLPAEVLSTYLNHYTAKSDLRVMVKTFADALTGSGRDVLERISRELPESDILVHLVIAEKDKHCYGYMLKLKSLLPKAKATMIPACGHFLQEEAPQKLAEILVEEFSSE